MKNLKTISVLLTLNLALSLSAFGHSGKDPVKFDGSGKVKSWWGYKEASLVTGKAYGFQEGNVQRGLAAAKTICLLESMKAEVSADTLPKANPAERAILSTIYSLQNSREVDDLKLSKTGYVINYVYYNDYDRAEAMAELFRRATLECDSVPMKVHVRQATELQDKVDGDQLYVIMPNNFSLSPMKAGAVSTTEDSRILNQLKGIRAAF